MAEFLSAPEEQKVEKGADVEKFKKTKVNRHTHREATSVTHQEVDKSQLFHKNNNKNNKYRCRKRTKNERRKQKKILEISSDKK